VARTTREARVRRMAARQGLTLVKSRRRDPRALDYGRFTISNQAGRQLHQGTLAQIEEWLTSQPVRTAS
jgi:hypothetical protein